MDNFLSTRISAVLTDLGIEHYKVNETVVGVERDSMVNANPSLDENDCYTFIMDVLKESFPKNRLFWGNKTDDHIFTAAIYPNV
jgi:hypothetical protein